MGDHLTSEEIGAFVRGELAPLAIRTFVRHLLRNCRSCRELATVVSDLHRPGTSIQYDAAIDRARSGALRYGRRLERNKQEVRRIVGILEEGGLSALASVSPKKSGTALAEALLERSWALRHEDPSQMVGLARLAILAVRDLDHRLHDPKEMADLQCRAYAELGNALRVAEDLDEADAAFHRAYDCHLKGTQDPLLLARLLDLHSSLFRARRQFKMARNSLALVYTIYRRYQQPHFAGRALISVGIMTGYAGDPEKALRYLERGFKQITQDLDPELVLMAVHNQLWFTVECERFEEAERFLFLNRKRYQGADRLNRLKLRWLEARIDQGLGRHERAASTFEEVKDGFDEAGQGFPAALASLDLALLLMRRGRTREAQELALQAAEAFRGLQVEREMFTAIMFLREAFTLGLGRITLLEDVVAFLRRAEHDPSAKFEPRPL